MVYITSISFSEIKCFRYALLFFRALTLKFVITCDEIFSRCVDLLVRITLTFFLCSLLATLRDEVYLHLTVVLPAPLQCMGDWSCELWDSTHKLEAVFFDVEVDHYLNNDDRILRFIAVPYVCCHVGGVAPLYSGDTPRCISIFSTLRLTVDW